MIWPSHASHASQSDSFPTVLTSECEQFLEQVSSCCLLPRRDGFPLDLSWDLVDTAGDGASGRLTCSLITGRRACLSDSISSNR